MFEQLILPLVQDRTVSLTADYADASYRKHKYEFDDIDIVLLEGIFLFRPRYRDHFELRVWVDCSFERALKRAIARGQEGLTRAETSKAFEMIYFPAQRIHLVRDKPRDHADLLLDNEG